VAGMRARHQLLDQPPIFEDPLALRILGAQEEAGIRHGQHVDDPLSKALRTALAVRSRLAEDEWTIAEQAGVRQYVILGAGLDTYAYRHPTGPSRIFEVDLPTTQRMKRSLLQDAGIAEPDTVRYVPVDFETESLNDMLSRAGFDKTAPVFFSWLGVTPYLDEEAVLTTLRFIAACASGSKLVFDYIVQPALLSPMERMGLEMLAAKLAEGGEPLKTFFDPAQLEARLRALGFAAAASVSADELHERYLKDRADGARVGNVTRLMHACV
jgi:methyltransferase (TIGR00027 family)